MSRDPGRPAAHPLVELVHDLRDSIGDGEDGLGGSARSGVYDAVRGSLHAARRLVDALELLVIELEARRDEDGKPAIDEEADDVDFQRIRVR